MDNNSEQQESQSVVKKVPLLAIFWFIELLPKDWPKEKTNKAVEMFIAQAPDSTDEGEYACVVGMKDFAKKVVKELGE